MSQPPQNMIQRIQPADVTRLLDALKEELAQAKAAGADTAKARQHYAKANQIKQVLVNYQQQQKAAAARAAAPGLTGGAPTGMNQGPVAQLSTAGGQGAPITGVPVSTPSAVGGPIGPGGPSAANAKPFTPVNAAGRINSPSADALRPGAATVTTEKYNQVRARLQDLERKIRALEAGKRPDMAAEEAAQIDSQLSELKLKYGQYSKFAIYMRNQLMDQARGGAGAGQSPAAASPMRPASQNTAPAPTPALTAASPTAPPPQGPIDGPTDTPATGMGPMGTPSTSAAPANGGTGTPDPSKGRSASPVAKESTVPGFNLAGITKPSVPSMPILSTINVKPATPVTLKPGANNMRPTLSGGGASGFGQIMGTPAVMRMPTFDMALSGPIPDNSGRVLTKRKLTELVNTMGADDGDGKTTIDGDVEELLLDLADEFVSLVTSFACRLAKHRKTDSVDVRDVQLHLERNWNIRVPGHAMDEIRAVRKWQPSSSYNLKVSGVEIAKAVNGNIN